MELIVQHGPYAATYTLGVVKDVPGKRNKRIVGFMVAPSKARKWLAGQEKTLWHTSQRVDDMVLDNDIEKTIAVQDYAPTVSKRKM